MKKLEFEYAIYFRVTYMLKSSTIDWKHDRIQIPAKFNDRLEDIVGDCVKTFRTVHIMHDFKFIISIHSNLIDCSNPVPPFRDELVEYEQGYGFNRTNRFACGNSSTCFYEQGYGFNRTYVSTKTGSYRWELH